MVRVLTPNQDIAEIAYLKAGTVTRLIAYSNEHLLDPRNSSNADIHDDLLSCTISRSSAQFPSQRDIPECLHTYGNRTSQLRH